jgi:aspartate aminotransferase, mitochondrial
MSVWSHVVEGPKDPILGVSEAFKADSHPKKINLGVGAYRDDNGKPVVLPSVLEASQQVVASKMDNEYASIEGDAKFLELALKLAYGDHSPLLAEGRVAAVQSLSGTGALRVLGAFISKFSPKKPVVYVPNPTWGNHITIFNDCGLEVKQYRYYLPATKGLDLKGLLEDLSAAHEGSVVILHASAHNPTGVDPTMEQWAQISNVAKARKMTVLFDMAYQGFASGDPDKDVGAVRMFLDQGHDIMLAQSFAKNFGLYGQRVGVASIVCANKKESSAVLSQVKILARAMYSNPPVHGARLVKIVLGDARLKEMWKKEVNEMATRIISMRKLLRSNLEQLGSKHSWKHITDQIGMFAYTGLTAAQVERLKNEFHIYLTSNGRISMAGVSTKNVKYLAEAIYTVTKDVKSSL